ncbi:PREDICTED: protein fuzzy homolog [Priapulus caudatus]|uniref:Protein fuzzy homolog n=1 Tax=Priapulus caudatus TaxID=37621 RepID=A0ABM1DQR6_PRICU|nr:PREDICTED: protein fuzzy homolog [Priapulus caudatus]
MAAYLLCLTTGGGVPLFSRTKGEIKTLPFAVIGTLNGVHMFASTHNIELLATQTKDAKIAWKVCHGSITLILVTRDDGGSDACLRHLLAAVFDAMVLLVGLDDLINIKNVERLKRELKCCYKLIDCLLDQCNSQVFGDLTGAVDVVLGQENTLLQGALEGFVEYADSTYGCLLVRGKVAVATKKWWGLTGMELVLISLLVSTLPPGSSRDIPVFLPQGSPTVPHRLCTLQLTAGVEACVLCGPAPSLARLSDELARYWRPPYESVRSLAQLHPRNFSHHLRIDPNILGFVLVNTEAHRCLCSVQPRHEDSRREGSNLSYTRRRAILRSFYKHTIGHVYAPPRLKDDPNLGPTDDISERLLHRPQETYMLFDAYKCYSLQTAVYRLFVLYGAQIPHYALRSVTRKTLEILTKDKQVRL